MGLKQSLLLIGILLSIAAASFAVIDIPRLDVPLSSLKKAANRTLTVSWNDGSFNLVYQSQSGHQLVGRLGLASIPPELGAPSTCDSESGFCWTFSSFASLTITPVLKEQCYSVEWQTELDTLGDCFKLEPAHWYGGAEVYEQSWPITGDTTQIEGEPDMAYVTGDFFQRKFAGVMEPYWINSHGFGIRPLRENPLFFAWNSSGSGELCLNARYAYPFPLKDRQDSRLSLRYLLCSTNDAKDMHMLALANNFWEKPRSLVDERMLTHPVWSTWARYKTLINQNRIVSFAQQIRQYGFNDSQLEIDDRWEDCYGEHRFDTNRFPDPGIMVSDLHDQGFRVTLWVHPFINSECSSFASSSEHIVKNAEGNPAITSWWQGNSAGYFDFTRQTAADWWSARITKLSTDYGLDGFKVDAGETNWLPVDFDFTGLLPANSTPNGYSTAYARNMERFGKLTEIRTGWASQEVPIFTRMLDKDTYWGKTNGLATLIPTLLHFNVIGYPFVLPDMIGGNGYNGQPDKELFIRWMQANVFMPAMQFSYTPWDYDDETVTIAQRMTALHYQYAPMIIALAKQATIDGTPINRPLWWIDPLDPVALTIDSEYLLGDDVLAAPILESDSISRDIYLPVGSWRDEVDPAHPNYDGPVWLRDYPAPLDTLPYFIRI